MKKVTYVVLFDVETLDRKTAENIENEEIEVFFASGCQYGARLPIIEQLHDKLNISEGIDVMSLSDFMDAFNDEDINEVGTWISYVQVTIETQADRDRDNEEFNDFLIELRALCDEWGYPHMTPEQEKEAFEEYEARQVDDPTGSHVWVEDALYSIYDTEDKMDTIEYKDEKYPIRKFKVQLPEFGEPQVITISNESLDASLRAEREYNEEMDLGRSSDEQDVDDQIYFFVPNNVIGMRPEVICAEHLDEPIEFIEEVK